MNTVKRGGARPGSGAPRLVPGQETKSVQIRLDPAREAKAREIGGGNLAAGIRAAIDSFRMEDVSEGRVFWEEYLRLVGDDYSPTTKGLASLAGKLGVNSEHLQGKIMAYLTAHRRSSR